MSESVSVLVGLVRSVVRCFASCMLAVAQVFALFDKVCILTRGELVYFGGEYVVQWFAQGACSCEEQRS